MLTHLIEFVYRLLWGDLFTLPVGGGIGISLMVVLLFTAGIWFTLRTRLLPVRLFRDMIAAVCEKNQNKAAARPTTCTHWLSVGAAKNSGTRSRRRCLRCRA